MLPEKQHRLYSVTVELQATRTASLPHTTGHLVHAMFLNLVKQFDPAHSAQLHDMQGPRPFTLSSLVGGIPQGSRLLIQRGAYSTLRLTLLDGGTLWQRLSTHFLEAAPVQVQIGEATFHLVRLLSTPAKDANGWANITDWRTLMARPASPEIRCSFRSPTAFSLGLRIFSLVPSPLLVWTSALRSWNVYAPVQYHFDRLLLSDAVKQIRVASCDLHIEVYQYPRAPQKGFVGTCCYLLPTEHELAPFLTTLASFAQYAGVGYKTTMGMGQLAAVLTNSEKRREMA